MVKNLKKSEFSSNKNQNSFTTLITPFMLLFIAILVVVLGFMMISSSTNNDEIINMVFIILILLIGITFGYLSIYYSKNQGVDYSIKYQFIFYFGVLIFVFFLIFSLWSF
ncbi:MAG: hypothetical protein HeimC3_44000 [Candidatus Heimdallarchaeota archaeon LC_3]|nr:MAG: hypothetical protein HeimC3_44000 [Candidatus Heimdallarchaeota archaeon LC_3]